MKFFLLYIFTFTGQNMNAQEEPTFYKLESSDIDTELLEDYDCNILEASIDREMVEFKSYPWFSHTPVEARKFLGNKNLISANAHIYKTGDQVFIVIDIIINSARAKEGYGDIEFGAAVTLFLAEGENIHLKNIDHDRGNMDRKKELTTYQAVCLLDKHDLKKLQKEYIYKLGIRWEEGYEEYEIINIDLIKNQLNCLK